MIPGTCQCIMTVRQSVWREKVSDDLTSNHRLSWLSFQASH